MLLPALAATVSAQSQQIWPNCSGGTPEMNACMAERLDRAEKRLHTYRQKAIERHTHEVRRTGRSSATPVYEDFKEGTIRGIMTLGCQLRLTNERTRAVWANRLQ
jgi:uncharacterized protein YecT (DUF1311 family)